MMACRQDFLIKVRQAPETQKRHLLRQIHISSLRVLAVHRSYHKAVSHKKLVLHLGCKFIFRVDKGQRCKIHLTAQGRLHVFAVNIGQHAVAQSQNIPEPVHMVKLIDLLHSGSQCRMISHKR